MMENMEGPLTVCMSVEEDEEEQSADRDETLEGFPPGANRPPAAKFTVLISLLPDLSVAPPPPVRVWMPSSARHSPCHSLMPQPHVTAPRYSFMSAPCHSLMPQTHATTPCHSSWGGGGPERGRQCDRSSRRVWWVGEPESARMGLLLEHGYRCPWPLTAAEAGMMRCRDGWAWDERVWDHWGIMYGLLGIRDRSCTQTPPPAHTGKRWQSALFHGGMSFFNTTCTLPDIKKHNRTSKARPNLPL